MSSGSRQQRQQEEQRQHYQRFVSPGNTRTRSCGNGAAPQSRPPHMLKEANPSRAPPRLAFCNTTCSLVYSRILLLLPQSAEISSTTDLACCA